MPKKVKILATVSSGKVSSESTICLLKNLDVVGGRNLDSCFCHGNITCWTLTIQCRIWVTKVSI